MANVSAIKLPNNTIYNIVDKTSGYTKNTGTVTSVAVSAGTGISVSGSPITSSGTINLGLKLGYTTSGNNRAVQADSNGNLYVVQKDNNTTYTFANGTNEFTVTPSGGTAQTVTVTPSIADNITGSGTSGYIAKFNGENTITNGPAFGSATTTYLRNDGTWATPSDTNTHRPIQMNDTEILGNNTTALNLKAGSNVSLSNSSGTVTIAATDTTYSRQTPESGGTTLSLVNTGDMYTWDNKSSATNWLNGSQTGSVRTSGSAAEDSSYTIGEYAVAEGYNTTASGDESHAEGYETTASGHYSHAEGRSTTASSMYSHAEGYSTTASHMYSHAEGCHTTADGMYSHAGGNYTIVRRKSQTAIGEFNIIDTTGADGTVRGSYAFIIGNGTTGSARSNALTVDWSGKVECGDYSGILRSILDIMHPIGSWYQTSLAYTINGHSYDDDNLTAEDIAACGQTWFDPRVAWGGQWELLDQGIVLSSAGGTTSVPNGTTKTGGNNSIIYTPASSDGKTGSHKLEANEIPQHNHGEVTKTGTFNIRAWGSSSNGATITGSSGIVSRGAVSGTANGIQSNNTVKGTSTITINATHTHSNFGGTNPVHSHTFTGKQATLDVRQNYKDAFMWHRYA